MGTLQYTVQCESYVIPTWIVSTSMISYSNTAIQYYYDLIGFGLTEPVDAHVGIRFGLRTRT